MLAREGEFLMNDATYDRCVAEIYRAAGGATSWEDVAESLAGVFDLIAVHIIGVDKHDGSLMFSWGGRA
ncbi:MAG: hypothetical protein R3E48_21845 [Burkholderiaceae bacterium]